MLDEDGSLSIKSHRICTDYDYKLETYSKKLFPFCHFNQGRSQCLLWEVITCRVKFRFSNCKVCDDVIFDNHCETFAAADQS
mmetsp:Transcript_3221/g.8697  ORF Transcript_3221/g.8697 Transcript_3221/m.8697 type:complete len:82 (-) Transcript_3221:492-737(-)